MTRAYALLMRTCSRCSLLGVHKTLPCIQTLHAHEHERTHLINSSAALRTEYKSDKSRCRTCIASDVFLSSSTACCPLTRSLLVMYTLALRARSTCQVTRREHLRGLATRHLSPIVRVRISPWPSQSLRSDRLPRREHRLDIDTVRGQAQGGVNGRRT